MGVTSFIELIPFLDDCERTLFQLRSFHVSASWSSRKLAADMK